MPTDQALDQEHRAGASYAKLASKYATTRSAIAGRLFRFRKSPKPTADPFPKATLPLAHVTATIDHNCQEVESKGGRIQTLEQLIAACRIDLETWKIERHVINKWEVGAKDLNGNIVVEPLFQVKAAMVKRAPVAVQPVISPILIQPSHTSHTPPTRALQAALIVPDTQFGFARDVYTGQLTPFHDRAAIDTVLQIAQQIVPDQIIFLGDLVDWSGWSDKFIHLPEFYFTAQPALIEASWVLAQFRALTTGRVLALEGNHDQRPEKMLIGHLVDAYGLKAADQLDGAPVMSVDNLLGLSRMGVEYVTGYPDGEAWINANTKCIHGERVRSQPGQTASAVVRDANESVIFGHIHRREMATKTIPTRTGPRIVSAYSPGCLCHTDGRVPGSKRSDQWQQGAAVIWYDAERVNIEPIDIAQGQALWGGQVYSGADYCERLRADTGWEF
jgi:predicted phosphodiesterase